MKISANDVKLSFGSAQVLHGVGLETSTNELVGVLGPNGSGKTTLLKCIYRTLTPDSGAIFIDGKELSGYSYRESSRKIAVLAQHNFYNFDFTVHDVVLMGRAPYKRALDRDNATDYAMVARCLDLVGMGDFSDRSFRTLSGGEQQRVILARALVQDTPCLILDEPTNHLDIKYQLQLMDLVSSLGRTVIAAIHDLNVAAMYCDRLYLLKNGVVVASGTPDEVLTEATIAEVYEVDAKVFRDEQNILRITYTPSRTS